MTAAVDSLPPLPARSARADALELLASMRFAIALLTVICIASAIGTVLQQGQPLVNYVDAFGPYWADVFGALGLFNIYSSGWFLVILAFLVISTSLCIARNVPKILADLRTFKENVRVKALDAFHHKAHGSADGAPAEVRDRVLATLAALGWQVKAQERLGAASASSGASVGVAGAAGEAGTMIAARRGTANKLGYIAAHSAIVLVCLGGLADGDLIVKAQMALLGKQLFSGGGLLQDVPEKHRLSERNPTFRANLLVPEGARAGTAVLSMPGGVMLQPLPFDVELKKFKVEYYATGMPKLFASDIVIHDRATGTKTEHVVEVNKPVFHSGVAIYQSSFDDGGSAVTLQALPLRAGMKGFEVKGQIGGKTELIAGSGEKAQRQTLEFAALRLINVENLGTADPSGGADSSGADVRKVDLGSALHDRLGSGAKAGKSKDLHNIGPSITYRLRDASGQAREFHNYMAPVALEKQPVFLVGVRESTAESFRYLRLPADENSSLTGWLRLRQALDDPAQRDQAARRYVKLATPLDRPEMAEQLLVTTRRVLALFAGAEGTAAGGAQPRGGLQGLGDFIETSVPENDRRRISEVMLRILNGALFELLNVSRETAGSPALQPGTAAENFMQQAVTSLSDSFFYPVPLVFQLSDFTQVQASVFQVARAPGKNAVYLGAVLLIIGVFAMLYIRERRLWIWITPREGGGSQLTAALATTRRTLDADDEFDRIRQALLKETA